MNLLDLLERKNPRVPRKKDNIVVLNHIQIYTQMKIQKEQYTD